MSLLPGGRFLLILLSATLLVGLAMGRRHRRNDMHPSNNQCYSMGRGQKCLPPFDNVAAHMPVQATSTCGNPPSRVCRTVESGGRTRSVCSLCDAARPDKWHPAAFLTDRQNPNNQTCWVSGPIDPLGETTVNLTLSFGKRFEILYIYLVPCGHMPDSIVYYKSDDFGKTWTPWRYFSKDCFRAFGMATMDNRYSYTNPNVLAPTCEQLKPLSAYTGVDAERIVFSTTTGQTGDDNRDLIEWRTATDLRVSMSRFRGTPRPRTRVSQPAYLFSRFAPNDEPQRLYYSFSQLSVGGRCKCNGHANRCTRTDGRLRCACSHNTQGDDCEECKPFFYDQPWSRATDEDAHVCKACNCNNHSTKCRFSRSAYSMSHRTTGGVCLDCQDNTAGPNCETCAVGYYRDPNRNINDKFTCTVCNCHPLGSEDVTNCDPRTGQCKCKSGVTGQMCNRCKKGYQQTNDPILPCKPVYNTLRDATPTPKCGECRSKKRRIRFKKFCRRDFAVHITIRGRQSIGSYVRFQANVYAVFRRRGDAQRFIPSRRSTAPIVLWVPRSNLMCNCPDVRMGRSYLLLSDANVFRYEGQPDLILNHKSTVLPWMTTMRRRMIKFKRKDKRGRCPVGRRLHRKRNISKRRGRQRKKGSGRRAKQSSSRRRVDHYNIYRDYYRGAYQGDDGTAARVDSSSSHNDVSNMNDNNYGYYGTN